MAKSKLWEVGTMRAFITACVVAVVLAIGAAALLNQFVQRPADSAFSTTAVRI
jgi:peptidoglycan/LPS O-acetylase OafA/YrhL